MSLMGQSGHGALSGRFWHVRISSPESRRGPPLFETNLCRSQPIGAFFDYNSEYWDNRGDRYDDVEISTH